MTGLITITSLLILTLPIVDVESEQLTWPPAPAQARLEYVGQMDCRQLKPQSGFFGRIAQFVGGKSNQAEPLLPFDVMVTDDRMFMICQNLPALVEIDRDKGTYRLHYDKNAPFAYPIALADGGDGIVFITDSEAGTVYKYQNGKVSEFITENLNRPTGIAVLTGKQKIFIVDTGEHRVKIFDYQGNLLKTIPDSTDTENRMNFPTFAAITGDGTILVNDALNYRIHRFDDEGNFITTFGSEGDGPGCFARPKGIAADSDGHIYVMDNLFDNMQIFDDDGRILLVVGESGQMEGQFWSPAGIDITRDTIFIADTYNNRVQMLRYLGDSK